MRGGKYSKKQLQSEQVSLLVGLEPTGNLDTKTGHEIFSLFGELHSEGETVLIVTRNPGLAARTRRTITLKDGLAAFTVEN